jgi:hypothetical protein
MKHGPLVMVASVSLFAIAGPACSSGEDSGGGAGGMAGSAAGSSGASGMGGSAGTAGASGSAGSAGSGATGGSGGASGSAGSAGTGGASGGGAGGTTGDRCSACLQRECGAATTACNANTDCSAILECVIAQSCGEIPEPPVCINDCAMEHPDGRATFEPLTACITDTCVTDCSGS